MVTAVRYGTLEGVVRHHLDPIASLNAYLESAAVLPVALGEGDFAVMRDPDEVAKIAAANALEPSRFERKRGRGNRCILECTD